MSFVVSARKYRPQLFTEIVGQNAVTTTLRNALKNDKLAHAFLFTGPRGVGKTSCARILAKTINCENPTTDHEACGVCVNCTSFSENSSLNIFELDAASNNSVENIRELIDQVRFAPQMGKYKVYIIDEVHMLSAAAFNAFLKTLEEPPEYAIFILATTEKHKIIPTILSRCQIYDFNRITVQHIVDHLKYICQKENYTYDDGALMTIAQKSEGGLRDALSILDRLVSFTNGNLDTKGVLENLNILDYDTFFEITESIVDQNLAECLKKLHVILQKGFEADDFLNGLAEHLRSLMISQMQGMDELLNYTEFLKSKYIVQSQKVSYPFLVNALAILNDADVQYKTSKNKRLLAEITLMRLVHIQNLTRIDSNISLTENEKKKSPVAEPRQSEENTNSIDSTLENKSSVIIENEAKSVNPVASESTTIIDSTNSFVGKSFAETIAPPKKKEVPHVVTSINKLKELNAKNTQIALENNSLKQAENLDFYGKIERHELVQALEQFAKQIVYENKSAATIYANAQFDLIQNKKIVFKVNNLEVIYIQEMKFEFIKYLQKHYQIHPEISCEILAAEEQKIIHPDVPKKVELRDKYLAMKEKNPVLDQLKEVFKMNLLDLK